jgi:DNA-binding NarL/FixJ family response regulator
MPLRFAWLPVLLVGSNPARGLLAWSLGALACYLRVARDTGEALDLVRDWHPRLVIVDLDILAGESAAAVRRLRVAIRPTALFVAVTTFVDPAAREWSRHDGYDEISLTPRDPVELHHFLQAMGVRPPPRT